MNPPTQLPRMVLLAASGITPFGVLLGPIGAVVDVEIQKGRESEYLEILNMSAKPPALRPDKVYDFSDFAPIKGEPDQSIKGLPTGIDLAAQTWDALCNDRVSRCCQIRITGARYGKR